jgi:RHS repeat-associated protein
MLTGRYGHVKERYEYDAYGSPYSGRFEQGNNMNPYGFTGQRYEVEINVYAFAYRAYNPVSMRWMTPDPVRDGMNWYVYVNGDPVNLWNPLGLCDEGTNYLIDLGYRGAPRDASFGGQFYGEALSTAMVLKKPTSYSPEYGLMGEATAANISYKNGTRNLLEKSILIF